MPSRHALVGSLVFLCLVSGCPGPSPSPLDAGTIPDDVGAPLDTGRVPDDATSLDAFVPPLVDASLDAGTDAAGTPSWTLEPGFLSVTDWTCGVAATPTSFTLRNTGMAAGSYTVGVVGEHADWVQLGGATTGTLGAGSSAGFTAQLVPPAGSAGVWNVRARIVVTPSAGNVASADIEANRVGPVLFLSANGDFGDVAIGGMRSGRYTLRNDGVGTSAFEVSVAGDAAFTASITGVAGSRVTLRSGESAEVVATFSPSSAGERAASLVVRAVDEVCFGPQAEALELRGNGLSGALGVSGDVTFPETGCGLLPADQTFTISNVGAGALSYTATLARGIESPFTLSRSSGTVGPGATQSLTISAARIPAALPVLPYESGDTLTITAGGETRTVQVSSLGGGSILRWDDAEARTITALAGAHVETTFHLVNGGTSAADVSFVVSGGLTLSPATARLEPGARQAVTVGFDGTASTSGELFATVVAGACSVPARAPSVRAVLQTAGDLYVPLDTLDVGTAGCADPYPSSVSLPITNGSGAAMTITSASSGAFEVLLDGDPMPETFVLDAGGTRYVSARRRSSEPALGVERGSLSLSTSGATRTIALQGHRMGARLSVSASSLPSPLAAGVPLDETVTVTNDGNATVQVTLVHDGLGATRTITVLAGASESVTFARTPSLGALSDVVHLTTDATPLCAPVSDVTFAGTATAEETSLSAAFVGFPAGAVCHGPTPPPQTVRLGNTSATPIPYTAILRDGAYFSVFPASGTIPAHDSVELTVYVRPVGDATPGLYTDVATIRTATSAHRLDLITPIGGIVAVRDSATIDIGDERVSTSPLRSFSFSGRRIGLRVTSGIPAFLDQVVIEESADPMNEWAPGLDIGGGFGSSALELTARFSPAMIGERTVTFTPRAVSGAYLCQPLPGPVTITGHGTGDGGIEVSPYTLELSRVACGTTPPPGGILIDNHATGAITYDVTRPPMSVLAVSPSSATIAAGGRQVVTVRGAAIAASPPLHDVATDAAYFVVRRERLTITSPAGSAYVETETSAEGPAYSLLTEAPLADFPTGSRTLYTFHANVSETGAFTFAPSAVAPCRVYGSLTAGRDEYVHFDCPSAGGGSGSVTVSSARSDACTTGGTYTVTP
ncbi:MAG: choice-of-anchor D domain-containing protein [Sandaracinus sp.]